jgi:ankyrin repeat protein
MASWSGHLDVVKALIEARADVNEVNKVCWQLASTHTHILHEDT